QDVLVGPRSRPVSVLVNTVGNDCRVLRDRCCAGTPRRRGLQHGQVRQTPGIRPASHLLAFARTRGEAQLHTRLLSAGVDRMRLGLLRQNLDSSRRTISYQQLILAASLVLSIVIALIAFRLIGLERV